MPARRAAGSRRNGLGLTYAVSKDLKVELDWDHTQVSIGGENGAPEFTNSVNAFTDGGSFSF